MVLPESAPNSRIISLPISLEKEFPPDLLTPQWDYSMVQRYLNTYGPVSDTGESEHIKHFPHMLRLPELEEARIAVTEATKKTGREWSVYVDQAGGMYLLHEGESDSVQRIPFEDMGYMPHESTFVRHMHSHPEETPIPDIRQDIAFSLTDGAIHPFKKISFQIFSDFMPVAGTYKGKSWAVVIFRPHDLPYQKSVLTEERQVLAYLAQYKLLFDAIHDKGYPEEYADNLALRTFCEFNDIVLYRGKNFRKLRRFRLSATDKAIIKPILDEMFE